MAYRHHNVELIANVLVFCSNGSVYDIFPFKNLKMVKWLLKSHCQREAETPVGGERGTSMVSFGGDPVLCQ